MNAPAQPPLHGRLGPGFRRDERRRGAFVAFAVALAALGAHPVTAQTFHPMSWADHYGRPKPAFKPQRIAYGPDPAQVGDLWLPAGAGPHPLVILIHGGCWTHAIAKLDIMDWAADDLRRRGIAVWNIEYRGVDQPGGGYPGTFQDVAAATDFARTLARTHPLKLERVVVAGHSAGGHLALWTAARRRIASGPLKAADPLKVASVVDIAGLANLEADRSTGCGPEPVDAMAGPMRPGGRFADTSPAHMLPLGVRQVAMVGAQDSTVPPAVSKAYIDKARAAGDPAELIVIPDTAHAEEVSPPKPGWSAVAAKIVELAR